MNQRCSLWTLPMLCRLPYPLEPPAHRFQGVLVLGSGGEGEFVGMVVHFDSLLATLTAGFEQAGLMFGRDIDVLTEESELVNTVAKLWRELVEKIAGSSVVAHGWAESH
jgi:hypothetical protein